jgi:hypothetical protein
MMRIRDRIVILILMVYIPKKERPHEGIDERQVRPAHAARPSRA